MDRAKGRPEFEVHFLIVKDDDQYSALCYEYNIATCAGSEEAAFDDLMAATVGYLESFLKRHEQPPPRPASRELLLEFLDLDPERDSFGKEEVADALESCIGGKLVLSAPAAYSLRRRKLERPVGFHGGRGGSAVWPVHIYA